MHEFYEDLEEMCDTLADELSKTNEKLEKSGGQISAGDIEYIDKLTHAIKSIKTTKAMIESEGEYSGNYPYMRGRSYARGRKRDSMGRYSRDNDMVAELRELMAEAPDERTKLEFRRFISKIEQM